MAATAPHPLGVRRVRARDEAGDTAAPRPVHGQFVPTGQGLQPVLQALAVDVRAGAEHHGASPQREQ